ncbi:MAG TPA: DUF3306 domain-containing protein [Pseudolabrys sp.]|nr:DUF3306 domain-containing protein [Pseudolabrys sp.]
MSEPDNFLSRWSRRKREAVEREAKKSGDEAKTESGQESDERSPSQPDASVQASPELDIERLPPIESIDANTDITAFMRAGVPEDLKRAALRRAWSADPAIRDFMGPTENYWEAAGPDGVPGFGDLDPAFDVKRMVSELFGETQRKDRAEEHAPADGAGNSPPALVESHGEATQLPPPTFASETPSHSPEPGDENAAAQKESPASAQVKKIARRHGSAVPD